MSLESALTLSRLILRLGQVHRITCDADGRLESDTTHTVTLALLAGSLCYREVVILNRDLVVALALVHELAEAYAGDTSTLRALSPDARANKEARERAALERIRSELADLPWIVELLGVYEAQAIREARWVRYLDKVLPKLTHRDNGCAVPIKAGMSHWEFREQHARQGAELYKRNPEFVFLEGLFRAACEDAESQWGKWAPSKSQPESADDLVELPMVSR